MDVSKKRIVSARVIHGACKNKAQTGLYRTYRKMLARCYNKKQHCYNNYGGRGITVCEEWKKGFLYFKEWAYDKGNYNESISHLTIDRIDNDGNYEPSNCQFLTNSENVKKAWREKGKRCKYQSQQRSVELIVKALFFCRYKPGEDVALVTLMLLLKAILYDKEQNKYVA